MAYQTNNPALLVTTYTRLNKLSRCIESIQRCDYYESFDIHIFSDGAGAKRDMAAVNAVRAFLKSLTDSNIFLHFAEVNRGSRYQTRHGMKTLINLGYSSYLFLEEDITVSKTYLTYMAEHLIRFREEKTIKAFSAFTHAVFLNGTNRSAYKNYRFNPWGFGSWFNRDLWHEYISDLEIESKLKSFRFKRQLIACGYDVLPNIVYPLIKGKIVQGDYRATMMSVWFDDFSIYPRTAKAYNIGLDGSGINCSDLDVSDDYDFATYDEHVEEIPKTLILTQEFIYTRNFRRLSISIILLLLPYKWVKALYRCLLK